MNREIKFRAWSLIHNDMRLNPSLSYKDGKWSLRQKGPSTMEEDDMVLEQFTGIKDKNGVEIYEGDILHVGEFFEGDEGEPGEWFEDSKQTVEWGGVEYPAFRMDPGIDDECNDFSSVVCRGSPMAMEIIGNTHQNRKAQK